MVERTRIEDPFLLLDFIMTLFERIVFTLYLFKVS